MQTKTTLTKHKMAVARSFNRAAKTYDAAAFLEMELGARLLERLDFIKLEPKTILDLGGGTGTFSKKLAERYPKASIINLDLAEKLLQQSKLRSAANILKLCADAECLPLANKSVDFIFSNCMLHWILDLPHLFQEIHRILKPEGLLLFSSLGPDSLKELRESFFQIDSIPHVNHFMDMHLVGDALLKAEFMDPVMDMEQLTLTYPHSRRLIQDMKESGSNYVFRENTIGLSPKALFNRLSNHYDQYRLESGEIPASIEIIYGHAWANPKVSFSPSAPRSEEIDKDCYRISNISYKSYQL